MAETLEALVARQANEETALEDKHRATIAAWTIAAALRTIAENLPRLTPEAKQAYLPNWDAETVPVHAVADLALRKAEALELAAPVNAIDEEAREAVFLDQMDALNGLRGKDLAHMVTEEWTEAEWAYETERLAMVERWNEEGEENDENQ